MDFKNINEVKNFIDALPEDYCYRTGFNSHLKHGIDIIDVLRAFDFLIEDGTLIEDYKDHIFWTNYISRSKSNYFVQAYNKFGKDNIYLNKLTVFHSKKINVNDFIGCFRICYKDLSVNDNIIDFLLKTNILSIKKSTNNEEFFNFILNVSCDFKLLNMFWEKGLYTDVFETTGFNNLISHQIYSSDVNPFDQISNKFKDSLEFKDKVYYLLLSHKIQSNFKIHPILDKEFECLDQYKLNKNKKLSNNKLFRILKNDIKFILNNNDFYDFLNKKINIGQIDLSLINKLKKNHKNNFALNDRLSQLILNHSLKKELENSNNKSKRKI